MPCPADAMPASAGCRCASSGCSARRRCADGGASGHAGPGWAAVHCRHVPQGVTVRRGVPARSWHAQATATVMRAPLLRTYGGSLCALLSRVAGCLSAEDDAAAAAARRRIISRLPNDKVPAGSSQRTTLRNGARHFPPPPKAPPPREHWPWLPRQRPRPAARPRRTVADAKRRGTTMASLPGCAPRRAAAPARRRSSLRIAAPHATRGRAGRGRAAAATPRLPEILPDLAMHPTDSQAAARGRLLVAQGGAHGGARPRACALCGQGSGRERGRKGCRTQEHHRDRCAQLRARLSPPRALLTPRWSCSRRGAGAAAAPSAKTEAAPKSQAPSSATPPEARTVLVTQACPPQVRGVRGVANHTHCADTRCCAAQMVAVREGRGPWASTQFELQRLIGSGKTSNVYQVRVARMAASRTSCAPNARLAGLLHPLWRDCGTQDLPQGALHCACCAAQFLHCTTSSCLVLTSLRSCRVEVAV